MGSPVWKGKSWKFSRTKLAQRAASDPVWMPKALTPPFLIHIWSCRNSPFPLLALWGNKNWLPSMKVKKLEIFGTKSAKQAPIRPVWMPWALKPLCLIQFGWFPFSHFLPSSLWGNKNWNIGFIMGGRRPISQRFCATSHTVKFYCVRRRTKSLRNGPSVYWVTKNKGTDMALKTMGH